jgi:hypothetical protein
MKTFFQIMLESRASFVYNEPLYLAGELLAGDGVPHLVREPLRLPAGGGVVVQASLNHPLPATAVIQLNPHHTLPATAVIQLTAHLHTLCNTSYTD